MRQVVVFRFRTDLLNDRVSAMDLLSHDGIETIFVHDGARLHSEEEPVVMVRIEYGALSSIPLRLIELWGAQTTRRPVACRDLFFEANAVNGISTNFSLTDLSLGLIIIDRVRLLDTCP